MARLVIAACVVVATLAAAPRLAAAAGCTTCDFEGPLIGSRDRSPGPTRSTFLTWAAAVDIAFTAFQVQQVARGAERNNKITGLQLVMAVPVVIYGADFIKLDHTDWASWGLTLWSAGLMVHGFWPVLTGDFNKDEPSKDPEATTALVSPTVLVGWADQKQYAGLSLSGSF